MNRLTAVLLTVVLSGSLHAESGDQSDQILSRYQEAVAHQGENRKDVAMDVMMEATIPRLKKQGKLSALRRISNLGKVTYKVIGFWGDDTVKKEVIARYMTAEIDSAEKRSSELSITPANYHFKYKGLKNITPDRQAQVFEVKPKAKRVGLFKGEIWLDPQTLLPIREQGRFVKSPSVFIKKVDFVRDYDIRDGVAYLKRMESKTDTRIVGLAQLNIDYANYHEDDAAEEKVEEALGP